VEDDEELCDMVSALLYSPLPRNNRVGILSVGGGPAALAAEACEKEGLAVGSIGPATVAKLDRYLPPRWSRANPVDMAGPAMSDLRFVLPCIHALLEDDNIDFVFVQAPIIGSKEMIIKRMNFNPAEFKIYRDKEKEDLKAVDRKVEETGKPVVLSWISKDVKSDPEVAAILRSVRILSYSSSRRAARVMRNLFWYRRYLDHLK
jgi:acetyltransferase